MQLSQSQNNDESRKSNHLHLQIWRRWGTVSTDPLQSWRTAITNHSPLDGSGPSRKKHCIPTAVRDFLWYWGFVCPLLSSWSWPTGNAVMIYLLKVTVILDKVAKNKGEILSTLPLFNICAHLFIYIYIYDNDDDDDGTNLFSEMAIKLEEFCPKPKWHRQRASERHRSIPWATQLLVGVDWLLWVNL